MNFFRNLIFCSQFQFIIYNVRKHYYINKIMYNTLFIKKKLENPKINEFIRINPLKSNSKLTY